MKNRLTILIVDDMIVNRLILKGIIENDYNVIEAESGVRALELLEQGEKIDIILLDLIMPEMSGIEFLHIIKQDERYRNIPVIVNTQAGERENEVKALEVGADDFLVKPYHPEIVKRRIANIADKYIYQRDDMERTIADTTERLETLIDTVPGGIGIFEIGEKIITNYVNDGLCAMLGYTKEEFEENGEDFLEYVYEPDRAVLLGVFEKDREISEILHCKICLVKKDGDMVWTGISAKRLKDEMNRKIYDVVFMDLTEEVETELLLKASMEELKFRAERDTLTRLYNRETFYAETEKMLQQNPDKNYVIGHWNIDRFKVVNELFGSRTGDRILCDMADMIRSQIKGVGTYGRLEADHFVTCVPEEDLEESLMFIEEILSGAKEWNPLNYPVLLHVGLYRVEDRNISVALMCDRADMALQMIKDNHLKRWNYYNATLKESILNEQKLVNDMENALKEHQFVVYYQPIVDVETQKTISAEALVRWQHPENGMISPGLFIPLFEKNGFIAKLDMYVCEEVCRHQASQIAAGNKVVPVSVNLSRINFYNPNLCVEIEEMVAKYGISPEVIKLEITESAYKDNPQDLLKAINAFQQRGFMVLMDDFGSGYSSLNMLKDFKVDILKIDMKFMDNLETSERAGNILFTIIQLAKSLNMETVAEGVETKNQFEMLAEMGCGCIQGYYFSKPVPEAEFVERLKLEQKQENAERIREKFQTVLVVDDEEINRIIIKKILGDRYNVYEAANGREAMEILKSHFKEIKLVITDICMPEMDGLEMLERMGRVTFLKNMPVLVVTAYGEKENERKALELGALDVIDKPFDSVIFRKRIENLLKISEKENIGHKVRSLQKNMQERKS